MNKKKSFPKWKERTKSEKILTIIIIIALLIILITCILDIFNIYKAGHLLYRPLLAFLFLAEALLYRKYDAKNAKLLIIFSVTMMACFIISLLI